MEIHLHLSRQFRALDHKWGTPVDLDTSADVTACPDVQLDIPADTFSSESYLRAIKRSRPGPYSRSNEGRKRKIKQQSSRHHDDLSPGPVTKNSKLQDSGVSLSETERPREDGLLTAMKSLVEDLQAPLEESYMFDEKCLGGSIEKQRQFESVFKQLKNAAFSYVKKKYARRF